MKPESSPSPSSSKPNRKAALAHQLQLLEEQLSRKQREAAEQSLSSFIKQAWRYIDPAPYISNWHIDAIAEHLEAVVRGDIRHLMINVPPRCMKSISCSVALAPWVWAQPQKKGITHGPQTGFMYASYAQSLALRDSLKARRLIESPWYKKNWGNTVKIAGDQNAKVRFENTKGGYRLSTSVGSALTGEGGDIIVVDDGNNAVEIESELVREATNTWWSEALSTRHNNPKTGSFIVIQQRLHERDLCGHILETMPDDWVHLMLPMEYDPTRHCASPLGWEDPRTEQGELLWPERIGPTEVSTLKKKLGPYGSAGQLQQIPAPKGGGIIKDEWWQMYDMDKARKLGLVPQGSEKLVYPPFDMVVASVDTAYTESSENDYSACTVWGVFADENNNPRVMMIYAWRDRLTLHDLVERVAKTCQQWKAEALLIEAKASGISVIQEITRLHQGSPWTVIPIDPKGDKVARLHSIVPIFAENMIFAPEKQWAQDVIDEVRSFPRGRFKDFVDTVSQALRYMRDIGIAIKPDEKAEFDAEDMRYKKELPPLYDV